MPGDHFHSVSLSWPPTKQGTLLNLVRISQAVSGIVFCVLGSVESASRLVISSILEPDPQAPGSTTSGCANEVCHKCLLSFHCWLASKHSWHSSVPSEQPMTYGTTSPHLWHLSAVPNS